MKWTLIFLSVLLVTSLVSAVDFGYNNMGVPQLPPEINYSKIAVNLSTNYSTYSGSADFWDALDTPADINTGDLTDDNTYVERAGDSMTGSLEIWGNYFIKWLDNTATTTYAYIMANTDELRISATDNNPTNFYYGNLGSNLGASQDGTTGNWNFANNVTATDVTIPAMEGNINFSLNHFFKDMTSAGRLTGGTITNPSGTLIVVEAGEGLLRDLDDDHSQVRAYEWAESGTINVPTDSIMYFGVDLNGGSPIVVNSTVYMNWDLDTSFPLGQAINQAGEIYILNNPWWVGDGLTNIIERFQAEGWLERDDNIGGLMLGYTGTRNPTMTAGTLWSRLVEHEIPEFTAPADTFDYYYRDGAGSYTKNSDQNNWSVTYWDDGTGTLDTLGNNQYAVIWVWVNVATEEIALMYPQAEYANSASAEAEEIPTYPAMWYKGGVIIGRIIIQEGEDIPVEIQSAFTTTFTAAQAADHGNLAGLADDDHADYWSSSVPRTLNYTTTGNITADTYFGDGSQLTGIVDTWASNYTDYYNKSEVDNNFSLYTLVADLVSYVGNWSADKVNYWNITELTNGTLVDNVTLNTRLGDYYLDSNPSGYISSYVDTNATTECGDAEYLRGDGTCQVISSSVNGTNINVTSIISVGNITTESHGLFGWLGSLSNRIKTLYVNNTIDFPDKISFSVGGSTTLTDTNYMELSGGNLSLSATHPIHFRIVGEENANLDGSNGGFEFSIGNGQEARTLLVAPCDGIVHRISMYCEVSTATAVLVNLTESQVDTACGVFSPGVADGISVADCSYEFSENNGLSFRTTVAGSTANQCIMEAWARCY